MKQILRKISYVMFSTGILFIIFAFRCGPECGFEGIILNILPHYFITLFALHFNCSFSLYRVLFMTEIN